jgi:hypothetical protein
MQIRKIASGLALLTILVVSAAGQPASGQPCTGFIEQRLECLEKKVDALKQQVKNTETGSVQFNGPGKGRVTFNNKFTQRPSVAVSMSCYRTDMNHQEWTDVKECSVVLGRVDQTGFDFEVKGTVAVGDGGAIVPKNFMSYIAIE